MARMLKLKRGSTELNLLAAEGAGWRAGSWNPAVAQVRYGRQAELVEEKIEVVVERDSHDNLAVSVQALDEMAFWADAYVRDRLVQEPVWLHAQMTAETGERRALVRKIEYEWLTPAVSATGYAKKNRAMMRIEITREPYWERTTTRSFPDAAVVPTAGVSVVYDYTAAGLGGGPAAHDIRGDVPARIAGIEINPNGAGDQIGRLWMGIRSDAKFGGDADNFEPVWECEDGVNNASESGISDTVDGTASGGSRVTVSEVDLQWDDTWQKCLHLNLNDVTTNERDNLGLFLWLIRAKVTSGTWEVELRWGYREMDDDHFVQGDTKSVSSTSWNIYQGGIEAIPLRNLQVFSHAAMSVDDYEQLWEVQIWARRTSGSGNLHLDCLCPIPVDEGSLFITNCDADGTGEYVIFGQGPLGVTQTLLFNGTVRIQQVVQYSGSNFQLPPGDGRMIIAYARKATSDITDVIRIPENSLVGYVERWLSLRGGE